VAPRPWALLSLQPLLLELERHSRSDYQLCTDLLSAIRSHYRNPRTVRRCVAVWSQGGLGCTVATPPKRCCFDANRGQDLRRFMGPSMGYFSQIKLGWKLTNFHCDASRTNFGRRKVCIVSFQCDYLSALILLSLSSSQVNAYVSRDQWKAFFELCLIECKPR
jgi:hypothetical protein